MQSSFNLDDFHAELRQAVSAGVEEARIEQKRKEKDAELIKLQEAGRKLQEDQAARVRAQEKLLEVPAEIRRALSRDPEAPIIPVYTLPCSQAVMFRMVSGNADLFDSIPRSRLKEVKESYTKLAGETKYFFDLCVEAGLKPLVVRSERTYEGEEDSVEDGPFENKIQIAIPILVLNRTESA